MMIVDNPAIDSIVKLCLQANGADGSNKFFDRSQFRNPVTRSGNAQMRNTQYKYSKPGVSMSFDGSSWLTIPHDAFVTGSEDFSISAWFCNTSRSGNKAAIVVGGRSNSIAAVVMGIVSEKWAILMSTTGTRWDKFILLQPRDINVWHHMAVVRNGETLYAYFDGVLQESSSLSGSLYDSGNDIMIGADYYSAGESWQGYLDDIVFRKTATDGTKVPTRRLGT